MDSDAVERKLAAILSADVVAYSRLMADDEEGTVRRLKQHREVIDGLIATHHGRLFGTARDSVIAYLSFRATREDNGEATVPGGCRRR